jgi:glycosyltransferase involved in cell wall biosynthesis
MTASSSSRSALALLGTFDKPDAALPYGTFHAGYTLVEALVRTSPFAELDLFSGHEPRWLAALAGSKLSTFDPRLLARRDGRYQAIYVSNGYQIDAVPHLLRPAADWAPVICQVGTAHHTEQWKNFLVGRVTGALRPHDGLIFKSDSARAAFARTWERWSDALSSDAEMPRHVVIPNGVDTRSNQRNAELRAQVRGQLGTRDEDVLFLAFSRLSPGTKGDLLALISLWSKVCQEASNAILVLAGATVDASFVSSMRVVSRLERASDNILILENPSALWPDARGSLMSAADAFIHVSTGLQETSSMVVHEALSHALPTIVTDWAGLGDIVEDEKNGWVLPTYVHRVPEGSSLQISSSESVESNIGLSRLACTAGAELVSLVSTLARSPDRLRRASREARTTAVRDFDSAHIAARHLSFIQDVAGAAERSGLDGLQPFMPLVDAADVLVSQAKHRLTSEHWIRVEQTDRLPSFRPHCFGGMPLPAVEQILLSLMGATAMTVADFTRVACQALEEHWPVAPRSDLEDAVSFFLLRLMDYGVVRAEPHRQPTAVASQVCQRAG